MLRQIDLRPAANQKWVVANVCLMALAVAPLGGAAHAAKDSPTAFECRFTNAPITIDGAADEPAWKNAQTIDNFTLPWLQVKARPAKTATRAKLLWDREHLYFFAEMDDSDLYADVKEHDGQTWDNDVFELFFKPAADKPGYYEFQVSAAGTVMDMFLPRRAAGGYKRFIGDGEFHLETKVKLRGTLNKWSDTDQGWHVEGRIPWRDFVRTGGRPAVGETWTFALCRYDYSVDFEGPELSTCAPLKTLNHPNFHYFEDYAKLKFVGPDQLGQNEVLRGLRENFRKVPSRVAGSPEPPPPYTVERILPNLKLNFPITAVTEPGTRRIWFYDQPWPYGPTRLCRTADDPATGEIEELWKIPEGGIGYNILFHPKFAENGYVYLGWNGKIDGENRSIITRYAVERKAPFKFDAASAVNIIEWASNGHNGVAIAFGLDGMFYVTSGDGTSDSDTNVAGQRLDLLLSKVLRIDVDHPEEGKTYSVPKDNPFVGQENVRPETWAYGFRNPWRMTVDARTGDLWVGNNGQDLWEQIYLVERGANYGWSVYEGSHPFYLERKLGPTPVSAPTFEHHHSEARSLTGGVVYYGKKLPELRGAYLYADHSTGKIWAGKVEQGKVAWHKELADTTLNIPAIEVDADGELIVVDHRGQGEGGFYTLVPNRAAVEAEAAFPRTLSESGLFASVKEHRMHPGAMAYDVNSPLWSDGAHKARFLVLPPKGNIDLKPTRGWGFPDGTVAVKSFAYDVADGERLTRKWIETRFLTRQAGEWVGYSYKWNDDGTDATLVANEGADDIFRVRAADGTVREQPWRFPSRTECMVCHSRAANFVLGLSTLQFNRLHDYGGASLNQLELLEELGVLEINWQSQQHEALKAELRKRLKADDKVNAAFGDIVATRGQRAAPLSTLLFRPPSEMEKLVDPYDAQQPLAARAKSYLHANCAQCHVEAGGGNAQMELEFTTALDKMRVVDVPPVHHKFNLPDARLIAPGEPQRSVLLYRMSHRGEGKMPQLATSVVDTQAVELLRQWILELKQ
jgi:glucose/arabinose dehydrogenase